VALMADAGADVDAVVIGAGPNGLVAANLLADAGWSVLVLEAAPEPGGGVRSGRYVDPDFVSDHCSAFYPLAAASPVFRRLRLDDHGLRWTHAPLVLAHPMLDGRCAVLSRDPDETAAAADELADGDGAAWRRLCDRWDRVGPALLDAVVGPFPPMRAAARLALGTRTTGGPLRFARFAALPVRRLAEEEFRGDTAMLLAGNALHGDFSPEAVGSGLYGWLLAMLGQTVGFPVPVGGAGALTAALVRRLEARGGGVRCNTRVDQVIVRSGRALGVRTADGDVRARRAVVADVAAPALFAKLVGWGHLPAVLRDDFRRFQWDPATFKIDWALSSPVPWTAPAARRAGTVHLGDTMDDLTRFAAHLATGHVPSDPFLLVGQMTTADPSRSPVGTESLWAYTHVPHQVRGDAGRDGITGSWDEREIAAFADRIEARIERFAPGFRGCVRARVVHEPGALERHDANMPGGALNGGTAAPYQQLFWRPTPGIARPETPIAGLYLASASAHPGGGVHGACGANAARAALLADTATGRLLATPARKLAVRALVGRGVNG
jgi:phytoene dehydrogenase-like protein